MELEKAWFRPAACYLFAVRKMKKKEIAEIFGVDPHTVARSIRCRYCIEWRPFRVKILFFIVQNCFLLSNCLLSFKLNKNKKKCSNFASPCIQKMNG